LIVDRIRCPASVNFSDGLPDFAHFNDSKCTWRSAVRNQSRVADGRVAKSAGRGARGILSGVNSIPADFPTMMACNDALLDYRASETSGESFCAAGA
jgi:hypothetical protein